MDQLGCHGIIFRTMNVQSLLALLFSITTLAYASSSRKSTKETERRKHGVFEPIKSQSGTLYMGKDGRLFTLLDDHEDKPTSKKAARKSSKQTSQPGLLTRMVSTASETINSVDLYHSPIGQVYDAAHEHRPEVIKPGVLNALMFIGAFLIAAVGNRAAIAIINFLVYLISMPPWAFIADIVAFFGLILAMFNIRFHRNQQE